MPILRRPGLKLSYDVHGDSGTPVLLIMGFALPGRVWRRQVDALVDHHRVCTYDHRGSGNSRSRPGPYSMRLLAEDAIHLLDELGWRRAHIVGISMGGMVAQRLALLHLHRVLSLTLIATHGGGLRARLPSRRGLQNFVAANVGPARLRTRAVKKLLYPDEYLDQTDHGPIEERIDRDFTSSASWTHRLGQLTAVGRHDARKRLNRLSAVPTLVVKPGLDALVNPRESDLLHQRIPGSRLVEFPRAGHGLLHQCADELNSTLVEFLGGVDVRRRGGPGAAAPEAG